MENLKKRKKRLEFLTKKYGLLWESPTVKNLWIVKWYILITCFKKETFSWMFLIVHLSNGNIFRSHFLSNTNTLCTYAYALER